ALNDRFGNTLRWNGAKFFFYMLRFHQRRQNAETPAGTARVRRPRSGAFSARRLRPCPRKAKHFVGAAILPPYKTSA
ncbi:hypothetical protein, partial [Halobacillus sp. BBL2006]|uniref:hypothetical protein n=1 Tax=Halobacillus sp. BBL2006 TaxID=1543706 RepID=UPI001E33FD79